MSVRTRSLWVLALSAAAAGAACGKKGPPVAPMVRIPAAVEQIAATRAGSDVYVTLAVPAANIDASLPVDIERIEVYGYTGRVAPARARWPELGALVATIPVAPPPVPGATGPAPPGVTAAGAAAGAAVTVLDPLTPGDFEQGPVAVPQAGALPPAPALTAPGPMRRFYLAIPYSTRGRPGPPGSQAELVLTALPDPPTGVRASHDADRISLAWEPSGGVVGFLLDRGLAPEPAPFVGAVQPALPGAPQPGLEASVLPGPTTYNVYREVAPDPLALPPLDGSVSWHAPLPTPMNAAPLAGTAVTDSLVFEREHCYVVRARRGMVLSEPSPRVCVTPVDIYPPAAPAGLAAIPSEGGISLIWEPNSEPDLGGYLVLRGTPGDATLRQLTDRPIAEARYRDSMVQPGERYIYSVVAVDSRLPLPNMSAESERVEETAR